MTQSDNDAEDEDTTPAPRSLVFPDEFLEDLTALVKRSHTGKPEKGYEELFVDQDIQNVRKKVPLYNRYEFDGFLSEEIDKLLASKRKPETVSVKAAAEAIKEALSRGENVAPEAELQPKKNEPQKLPRK